MKRLSPIQKVELQDSLEDARPAQALNLSRTEAL
jgi:hypothetical protein